MRIDNWIRQFEEWVCSLCLVAIVSLVIIQVFYRYVLSSGILWVDEVVTNLMVLMVMVGAGLATRNKVHTDLQVLVKIAPQKISFAMRLFAIGVVAAFLLILIYVSIFYAIDAKNLTTIMLDIPLWFVYGFIPMGGILTLYEFAKLVPGILYPEPTIAAGE